MELDRISNSGSGRGIAGAKIQWVTKWGLPSTKYVGVFQKMNARGKMSWYFAIFHKEKDRANCRTDDVKAMCSLFTISALVPDPKKENYVCLRYQPSKDASVVDLYFKVLDSTIWMESMHVTIEIVRKVKMLEMQLAAQMARKH